MKTHLFYLKESNLWETSDGSQLSWEELNSDFDEEHRYCVYAHISMTDRKRYIGITKQNPIRRWQNGNGYRSNELFYETIIRESWDGFYHIILEIGLSQYEAYQKEREYILKERSYWCDLGYNNNLGAWKSEVTEEEYWQLNPYTEEELNKFQILLNDYREETACGCPPCTGCLYCDDDYCQGKIYWPNISAQNEAIERYRSFKKQIIKRELVKCPNCKDEFYVDLCLEASPHCISQLNIGCPSCHHAVALLKEQNVRVVQVGKFLE